ncbi:MAG: YdeI/OmpD-associated family protein [Ferruginibacter sp.]
MATNDQRIDAYIAKSADFAKPILIHIRKLVHAACPDVEETMKWSFPHFDYKGEMMCSMAAFKQHAVYGFWKAALMKDKSLVENAKSEVAMGHSGKLTSLKDLPSDKKMSAWIKEAMKLNDEGIKLPSRPKAVAGNVTAPDYFMAAMKKNKKAAANYEGLSNSCKKEYIEWITEAKTEPTRDKRMATAIEWISEGKTRNWKYKDC